MEFKIKQREIGRKTHAILFGLLPLILWIIGAYMHFTTNSGFFGVIFYLPLFVDLVASWFFKTEKHASILDRIPEKIN